MNKRRRFKAKRVRRIKRYYSDYLSSCNGFPVWSFGEFKHMCNRNK